MMMGFLLSVLFGGDRKWVPWPTSVLVIAGFDFFLASAIYIVKRRTKLFALGEDKLRGFGTKGRQLRSP